MIKGLTHGSRWESAIEFDYANPESIYCRPLRKENKEERYLIDEMAFEEKLAFLQPMSGLSSSEDKLTPGSIDVRIGEGKTADVLRNICYQLLYPDQPQVEDGEDAEQKWKKLIDIINQKFGVKLNKPIFHRETGKIEMTYIEGKPEYELSSSGRGFQQTVLLLAYLFTYPNRVILLDEPDAHLEVIRQRETYNLVNDIASSLNSQLIIASHSEVVLNQAADRDVVIALFDDSCQRLNENSKISQFRKLLTNIGWEKYFIAKSQKHVIYLEGSTDLKMLIAFAEKLNHPVKELLERSNIQFTANNLPHDAQNDFHGLRSIIPDLKGIALFDRLNKELKEDACLKILQWERRELENYFTNPDILLRWAKNQGEINLFSNKPDVMKKCIEDNTTPANLQNLNSKWWDDCKISDDYLPIIFEQFYLALNIPLGITKGRYYELIQFIEREEIAQEIIEKLDCIYSILTK